MKVSQVWGFPDLEFSDVLLSHFIWILPPPKQSEASFFSRMVRVSFWNWLSSFIEGGKWRRGNVISHRFLSFSLVVSLSAAPSCCFLAATFGLFPCRFLSALRTSTVCVCVCVLCVCEKALSDRLVVNVFSQGIRRLLMKYRCCSHGQINKSTNREETITCTHTHTHTYMQCTYVYNINKHICQLSTQHTC